MGRTLTRHRDIRRRGTRRSKDTRPLGTRRSTPSLRRRNSSRAAGPRSSKDAWRLFAVAVFWMLASEIRNEDCFCYLEDNYSSFYTVLLPEAKYNFMWLVCLFGVRCVLNIV
ncbi:hypothetical protein Cni_G01813 [Canna indica]|uniref:Uncharacterized protein n=1 Tax=Canna indica TaxID=4628 RepID=A0AAQ3PYU8_9LILI|nr:hypothetical protein Cni_G01813 [Canna indica]